MTMDLRKFRVDNDQWKAAGKRAAAEGTNLSVLIRQWLDDYISGGEANADRAKVRLSAAERHAVHRVVQYWLPDADVLLDSVTEAINEER